MNGMAIEKMTSLNLIDMRFNECVDKWFKVEEGLQKFNQLTRDILSETCHFDEQKHESSIAGALKSGKFGGSMWLVSLLIGAVFSRVLAGSSSI